MRGVTKTKIAIVLISAILIGLLAVGYTQTKPEMQTVFSVEWDDGKNRLQLNYWENQQNECYLFLPDFVSLNQVKVLLHIKTQVLFNQKPLIHGSFFNGVQWDIPYGFTYSVFGKTIEKTVTFMKTASLPSVHISTASGNMDYIHQDKENDESGTVAVYQENGKLSTWQEISSIKGRGNTSWLQKKKSYSMALKTAEDLLGMGSANNWILLANATDDSYMRNRLVMEAAKRIGLQYTPDSRWVDLYLNGNYAGLYLLCERNEANVHRVSIAENTNSFLVSLEMEERLTASKKQYVVTPKKQVLRIHYPTQGTDQTLNVIQQKWQQVENAICAEDGIDPVSGMHYTRLIDVTSWAKKYIIEEVLGNVDAGFLSQYFYCDNGGKIFAGPVWDYDYALGNQTVWQLRSPQTIVAARYNVKDGMDALLYHSLWKKPEFQRLVCSIYEQQFLPMAKDLFLQAPSAYQAQIEASATVDRIRWQKDPLTTLKNEVSDICTYMEKRLAFFENYWVKGYPYCKVTLYGGLHYNYGYDMVSQGTVYQTLPILESDKDNLFLGWYSVDTHQPFDETVPITKDMELYAKWERSAQNQADDIYKLLPLGIFGILFFVVLLVEGKRHIRNRR